MPVVKNDWDIYKSNRSRRVSECSNGISCRSRKVSECKSEGPSLSTSPPGADFIVGSPAHRSVPANMSRQYSRASSRNSQTSLIQSPCKSMSSSPPKNGSQSSLNKFHNRLLDKLKRSLRRNDCCDNERTSSWGRRSSTPTPPPPSTNNNNTNNVGTHQHHHQQQLQHYIGRWLSH